nr:hypothetical protein [Tanacetum cinerariifolium]GEY37990.1 hypothetical protein [Tanacetum cinerariifolium]
MTDYALWEIIENGDSPPPKRTVDGVEKTYPPTIAEEKLARKNELKARDMYDSWKNIMKLYMMNIQHGRMILESVKNGLLTWPSIEENGVTRPMKYSELSATEAIQADCDLDLCLDLDLDFDGGCFSNMYVRVVSRKSSEKFLGFEDANISLTIFHSTSKSSLSKFLNFIINRDLASKRCSLSINIIFIIWKATLELNYFSKIRRMSS